MMGHNRLWAKALVIALSLPICAVPGWADQGSLLLDRSPPLVMGHTVTLQSAVLGEERQLLIFLPADYGSTDQPLPVVFLLDGRAHFRQTTSTVELLARNARMPRSMVVGIANTDRSRDFTSVAVEGLPSGGADRFLAFLETEVIPFIDGNFRTARHRTLIGHSLGGLFVMNVLAERPGLFDAAIAISPAITNDERVGERSISGRLATSLDKNPDLSFALFITMSDGEDGRWETDFAAIEELLLTSAPNGFRWEFRRMEGEDHGTTVLPSTFQGLRFINADWDTSGLVSDGTLDEVVTRFKTLSERLGYEIRPPEVMINLLGYRLLGEDRMGDAIEVFEFNVALYPESANVHDSLGEALERQGSIPGAVLSYRRAVKRAEAVNDRLLPVFRANLQRVEVLLERGDGGARVFDSPVTGESAETGAGPGLGR
jgi:predicted alpha/beta superfamily hydrolase